MGLECRGRGKNSNVSFVRPLFRSGFVAASGPGAVEIFSVKIPRADRYFGVNPKVRSKRLR